MEYTRRTNKKIVQRFFDHELNRGRLLEVDHLVSPSHVYYHEDQGALKGRHVLKKHLLNWMDGRMPHDNKLILASGDLVMAHGHYFGDNERVVFD